MTSSKSKCSVRLWSEAQAGLPAAVPIRSYPVQVDGEAITVNLE